MRSRKNREAPARAGGPVGTVAAAAVVALVMALVVPATSGCSEEPGASACTDYAPPAGFDALAPSVTFKADVAPIFARSCAFSTCHGANVGSNNGVYLGTDPARVYSAIVGVPSTELGAMSFVTPGDPRESYLMRKMDGSQCALDARCTGGTCQSAMPRNEPLLDLTTRDKVRRWIAQGAKND